MADEFVEKIKNDIPNWRTAISNYGGIASADSARYEFENLPVRQKVESKVGFITTPEKSETDELYSFFVVSAIHDQATKRSFDEAKGLVINDYQSKLEAEWIKTLKVKYPIMMNMPNWNTVK